MAAYTTRMAGKPTTAYWSPQLAAEPTNAPRTMTPGHVITEPHVARLPHLLTQDSTATTTRACSYRPDRTRRSPTRTARTARPGQARPCCSMARHGVDLVPVAAESGRLHDTAPSIRPPPARWVRASDYRAVVPNDYPNAPRVDTVDDFHGHPVKDPYRWLEDFATSDSSDPVSSHDPAQSPSPDHSPGPDHSGDPDQSADLDHSADPDQSAGPDQWKQWRQEWGAEQTRLLDEQRKNWTASGAFGERLMALLAGGFTGLPVWRGERQFFSRREPGQQFPVLYTVDPDGTERVLIDPMELDPSGKTTLDSYQPSWDGSLLAYLISEGGDEESVLRVMDVETREVVDGPIDRTRFSSVAWLPDGEHFYYIRRLPPEQLPEEERQFHRRVYLHRLGTDPDEDVEIFGSGRKMTEYFSASVPRSGRWLIIDAAEGTAPRNDVYLADITGNPAEPDFTTVVEGRDAMTGLSIRPDDRMFVWTDYEAPRGRILLGDPHQPQAENWRPLIDEDPSAVLESYRFLDGPQGKDQYLTVGRTRHSIGELALHDSKTGILVRELGLPGLGTIAGPVGRPEGSSEAWYAYTDHTTPPHIYRYDCLTDQTTLWAKPPGSITIPPVHTEQIVYQSADGTDVRMYIMAPASTGEGAPTDAEERTEQQHEPRPTILYGYGGFGVSLAPAFNAEALAWVESGGVYAIANLRGGSEEGEDWHRAGMLGNKQNVFDDFHAAAQYLVDQGWATSDQLCISGGSNGGLLVGAALVQRPDLYGAVICAAPLLDMIRYTTSQLGATWTVEYGDPQVAEQFDWLASYSPYHQVGEGVDYPSTLMMVFDNDTRTDPMHGRKMIAALQHATTGDSPIILRTEADVGHGARSLDKAIAETAESLAFAAHETGLEA